MIRIPVKSRQRIPVLQERRAQTAGNKIRRFINDFWLVPVLVIYLQLLAALMTASGDEQVGLIDKNRTFFSGVPLVAAIVGHDFPFTLIGHSKEMLHTFGGAATTLTPEEVAHRIKSKKRAIYLSLWQSRDRRDTEIGGTVSLQPGRELALYPIPSSNGNFIRTLKALPPEAALEMLTDPANRELVNILAGNQALYQRVAHILADSRFSEEVKQRTFASVIGALEVASEARYVVLPIDFKANLGHMDGWRYVGVYHFHNELASPPSQADIMSSYDVRQLIFCLTKDGFDLYDIEDGLIITTHFEVIPEAWITQPEQFDLSDQSVSI